MGDIVFFIHFVVLLAVLSVVTVVFLLLAASRSRRGGITERETLVQHVAAQLQQTRQTSQTRRRPTASPRGLLARRSPQYR